MIRPAMLNLFVRLPILIFSFASLGMAMTYQPFPQCTAQAKVDSIQTWVYLDEAMNPGKAPYRGYQKFTYHAGTCFYQQTLQKPYYMDSTIFTVKYTLSVDRRRLDVKWQTGGPLDSLPWGNVWFSEQGTMDSTLLNSYRREPSGTQLVSEEELYLRTAQYQTIKTYIRIGGEPATLYSADSIVIDGGVTTVHTIEDGESYITRCAQQGPTYACNATPVGVVSFNLYNQIWYLTGSRIDSLRTYDDQGRYLSTDIYYWSSQQLAAVRRGLRAGLRSFAVPGHAINLKGQVLLPAQSGSRRRPEYFLPDR